VYDYLGFPVVPDIVPGKGALGGIYTGLVHARSEYIFCVACDMPALNQRLIRYMQHSTNGYDVVVPKTPDGLHPLHAVYSKRCQPVIEALLHQNLLKISAMFPLLSTSYILPREIQQFDPGFESFLNVNTAEDLHKAQTRYEPGKSG
ncbi:NTP transferase domain-containing protein, partial [candidate division KSB3 bacterium]|nr:NTP transferase domain-containing protein [candidate division KSB3 bacterium]MBD3326369.1 NTP transferase domain-containing protein [candidate division KSB3 bacterium]